MKESDILGHLIEGYRSGERELRFSILGVDVRFQVKDHMPHCIGERDGRVNRCLWNARKVTVGWKQKATGQKKNWTFGMRGSGFDGADPDVAEVIKRLHENAWYYGLYRNHAMYSVTKHVRPVLAMLEVRTLSNYLAHVMGSYFLEGTVLYMIRGKLSEIFYQVQRQQERRSDGVYATRKVLRLSVRIQGELSWTVMMNANGILSSSSVDEKWRTTVEHILMRAQNRLRQWSVMIEESVRE
jgi:hypothetical protein